MSKFDRLKDAFFEGQQGPAKALAGLCQLRFDLERCGFEASGKRPLKHTNIRELNFWLFCKRLEKDIELAKGKKK